MLHTSANKALAWAATIALSGALAAQQVVVTQSATSDTMLAFSPIDGSLITDNFFAIPNTVQVSAIMVNDEVWVSEQTGDRVVRYDVCGNELGSIGPTFATGGLDNIRGMNFFAGLVWVTNDGSGNGATADSLVCFDTAGNHVQTLALSNSPSPFSVIPWQGDLLVFSSSAGDDAHRYTLGGVSVGTFHDSASVQFAHQGIEASDGNVWVVGFSPPAGVYKLDATTGNVIDSFLTTTATGGTPRGVFELQNGNVLWTNGSGVWVHDMVTGSDTNIVGGSCYHLNLIDTDYACHKTYGTPCHSFTVDNSNLFELFLDVPSAKAALDGNAIEFINTGNGYLANWLPGTAAALYVPPSAGATIVANVSTGVQTFTPSLPIPIPGGVAIDWTLSSEGILTAAATSNQSTTDTTPTLAETAGGGELAFYTWCTQNPTETGSGQYKWEEVGGVLYVTADGVELAAGTPTLAPSTYQWQIDMSNGNVRMVWTSFSPSNSTSDVLVGCTLAGTGLTPVTQSLAAVSSQLVQPDDVLLPLTLSASPDPVINPSTLVTYTADNVPEAFPGSGLYVGTTVLSFLPLPGGVDLTGILTNVAGCSAYVGSLDVFLPAAVSASPTLNWTVNFSSPAFYPGAQIAAQAVALFDTSAPLLNGESGGFVMSNGVLSTTHLQ